MTGGIARLLDQAQPKKGKHWVTAALDAYDKRQRVEEWREPSIAIHPSGLRSECVLSVQFDLLGHRGPIPMANRRRMANGTDAHKRWETELKCAGVLEDSEVPIVGIAPDVIGHMDFILKDQFLGTRALAELKTTNDRYYSALKVSSDPRTNMRLIYNWNPGYVYQIEVYNQHGGPFDELIFIVENTNDQRYKIIPVVSVPEYREEALRVAVPAQVAMAKGLVPRPFERESKVCQRCSHLNLCNWYEDGHAETVKLINDRLEILNVVDS